jgi:hypothetical protein
LRFHELVRHIRTEKYKFFGKAYTQKACGSRMTPPVGQNGWSVYETEDRQRQYDTVKQIAIALDIPDVATYEGEIDKKTFFKAAGYDVEEDLRIRRPTIDVQTYSGGELKPTELTPEARQKLESVASRMQDLLQEVGEILKK